MLRLCCAIVLSFHLFVRWERHTLHELDLITANENDWDDSNIYYKNNNGKKALVKDAKRYFSSLNTKDWDKDEIDFLENILIPKLQHRLKVLIDRQKK